MRNLLLLHVICFISLILTWSYSDRVFAIVHLYRSDSNVLNYWHGTSIPGHSFTLWKSIRLHPEDKRGGSKIHRYGEPLQLYVDNGQPKSFSSSTSWTFTPKANQFVNCTDIFLRDQEVLQMVQDKVTTNMKNEFMKNLQQANTSCRDFVQSSGYITDPLTKLEADFPIAYSILMYTDIEQFEILLRTIYRPQNVYCVHVDKKAPQKMHHDVRIIANCFDNVFVASYLVDVRWSGFSNLEPELICLSDLWQNKVKWKYFINLTGQEIPLRTNYELVRVLTAYDGANNVESERFDGKQIHFPGISQILFTEHMYYKQGSRCKGSLSTSVLLSAEDFELDWSLFFLDRPNPKRWKSAGPAPFRLTPVKGQVHVTISRAFADFVLHNETSLALFKWARKVKHPDEIYFSTLYYNKQLGAPGAYKGPPKTTPTGNPFITRLKHWQYEHSSCHGKNVRLICIFGSKDLPLLATREELFANKLHFGYHPEVMLCMQELLYNRTADEYEGRLGFNVTYYETRDFVKNKY